MERIVLKKLMAHVGGRLDPLQFAYKPKRGVEDATSLLVHLVAEHLEKPGHHVRILYVDFSSAFNTMRPSLLVNKLLDLDVDPALCKWVLNYLRERPQCVRVNGVHSSSRMTCIGAPQGCVLSPFLFTIYTDNHRGDENNIIIKYADDTALAGLIRPGADDSYMQAVARFVTQCETDDLSLNVRKTKEMRLDFRKTSSLPTHVPVAIRNEPVETVTEYKYLGTIIQEDLKWTSHVSAQVKKANQRLYFLRKLAEFNLGAEVRKLFYSSVIESVLLFGVTVWGGACSQRDAGKIQRIQRSANKTIGDRQEIQPWHEQRVHRVAKKARQIIIDPTHPLHHHYVAMPSRRRPKFRALKVDMGTAAVNRRRQPQRPQTITNHVDGQPPPPPPFKSQTVTSHKKLS